MIKSTIDSVHWAELFDLLEGVLAWVKDRQGRYLWINRAFLIKHALNHPGEGDESATAQILGKTDYDLSPAFIADQFRLDDEQVLAGHRIVNRIERVGESEGITAWSITNKIPVFNAQGAIIGTAGITRPSNEEELPGAKVSGFESALAHMRDNYRGTIANRQLASLCGMSLRAFERQFLASFHLTPQKYLRKLRVRIASRELIYTTQTVSEVALNCGFADQSHFSREFRRQLGRTPGAYRRYYKATAGASGIKSGVSKQAISRRGC